MRGVVILKWLPTFVATLTIALLLIPAGQSARQKIPETRDWLTAVRVVQKPYPGSSAWLISCSRSEGGHGPWVWFQHLSYPKYGPRTTPGGNLQYMASTFDGDYAAAVQDLHRRGFKEPDMGPPYFTALGQAIAGAWAWRNKGTGQWTGYGC